ncbi:hypothetical protein M406DRAFT_322788 [Cryphonectria parasitica EP155]|uniref:Uncharacterized protein n=1 Tax=Cryphonectria parasitica (strain ATCC 38755 / EP155) TaxID=660469 RepID=A0A9P5CPD3_CRYP1|nr:uncharacterized protein M406DRAFT_322788 [Cryphonectria parasitica EP155]KAF3764900.1 hypothetical protein M406DRAFT_322788 [Cryphonectria parasitica EP155]
MYPSSTTSTYGNQTQQVSPFTAAQRRPLPTTTAHQNPVHSVQGLPQNINGFSDFSNLNFDSSLMSSLDNSTTGHGNLGMNASYNMSASNVSRPSAGTNNFGFDSSLRNDGSSFFGLRR